MKLSENYNLEVIFPDIAAQWHPTKNGDLTPRNVTPKSAHRAWWKCRNGHEWQATVAARSNGSNCPHCVPNKTDKAKDLLSVHPDIAAQWHPTKNGNLKPDQVSYGSKKKVWWVCEKGHVWNTHVTSRSNGNGCPYCSGRKASAEHNLLTAHPDIAAQWHPTKNGNLTPDQVTPVSGKKVWWQCEHGHEWITDVANRTYGYGCPYCSGRRPSKEYNLAHLHPNLAKEWHPTKNGNLTPDKVTPGSGKKVWWRCENGHVWQAVIKNRSNGHGCSICAQNKRRSRKRAR